LNQDGTHSKELNGETDDMLGKRASNTSPKNLDNQVRDLAEGALTMRTNSDDSMPLKGRRPGDKRNTNGKNATSRKRKQKH
jgi:hypothetical protein